MQKLKKKILNNAGLLEFFYYPWTDHLQSQFNSQRFSDFLSSVHLCLLKASAYKNEEESRQQGEEDSYWSQEEGRAMLDTEVVGRAGGGSVM